jgi:tRNA_anti-like
MEAINKKKYNWLKRLLIIGSILFVIGLVAAWYIFTEKFEDTTKQKANFSVNAMDFIKEFQANDSLANKKYIEKMITVSGRVSETENADSTINIKMIDTLTESYIIFAFQAQNAAEAKSLKVGDSIAIKGSCSGGVYSEILETEFITFKRCVISK